MDRRLFALVPLVFAAFPAQAQFTAAWERGSSRHPTLGNVDFAVMRRLAETPVGKDKVYSRAYVSCQRERGLIAIELTNLSTPTDAGGLQPASTPKLTCNRKGGKQELAVQWEFNKIGDALAKGLKPSTVRECSSITIAQEVVLGPAWSQKSAKIEYDIDPTSHELDPIFGACGVTSMAGAAPRVAAGTVAASAITAPAPAPVPSRPPTAMQYGAPTTQEAPAPVAPAPVAPAPVAPAPVAPAPVAPVAQAQAAPAPPPPATAAPPTEPPWKNARTTTIGKSNVRAGPSIDTPIVMQLYPGSVILVQSAGKDWWKVRPPSGAPYGYIREDRLVFR